MLIFITIYSILMIVFSDSVAMWKNVTLTIIFLFQSFSCFFTMMRNPGIPKVNRNISNNLAANGIKRFKVCRECEVIMNLDVKTFHCYICQICVEGIIYIILIGFDHHCDILNKCIGKNNLKFFLLFIISTNIYLGFSLYLVISL